MIYFECGGLTRKWRGAGEGLFTGVLKLEIRIETLRDES